MEILLNYGQTHNALHLRPERCTISDYQNFLFGFIQQQLENI